MMTGEPSSAGSGGWVGGGIAESRRRRVGVEEEGFVALDGCHLLLQFLDGSCHGLEGGCKGLEHAHCVVGMLGGTILTLHG